MSKRTAGFGTITYRNGKWEAKVARYNPQTGATEYKNGNVARLSRSFDTKKEAESFLADYAYKRKHLKPYSASDMLLKDWVNTWFEFYKPTVKPYTFDTAETAFRIHIIPALGALKLSQLTTLRIQMFIKELTLSSKTIKNVYSFLNKCLSSAVDHNLMLSNPCQKVCLPRVGKPKIKPMNKAELKAFIEEVSSFTTVYDYIFYFTVFTGLRMGEVLGLTWDKVDLRSGLITVDQQLIRTQKHAGGIYHLDNTKSDNSRTFTLPINIQDMLKQYQSFQNECQQAANDKWNNELNLVFTMCDTGKWITNPTLHKHFKRVAKKIDRPDLRFHDLRHTYATNMAEAGIQPKTLSSRLGHSDPSFTMQYYVHNTDECDKRCASITDDLIDSLT